MKFENRKIQKKMFRKKTMVVTVAYCCCNSQYWKQGKKKEV